MWQKKRNLRGLKVPVDILEYILIIPQKYNCFCGAKMR